ISSPMASLTVKVDGVDCNTPCEVHRALGTVVRISAPASISSGNGTRMDFNGWPGVGGDWVGALGEDPVALRADYHMMNRLTMAATPSEGASWNAQPSSPDGYYDSQSSVSVTVTALPGYRFRSWNGDLTGTRPVGVLNMSSPRSVEALLDRVPYIAPAGVGNAAGKTPESRVAAGSGVSTRDLCCRSSARA